MPQQWCTGRERVFLDADAESCSCQTADLKRRIEELLFI
jgi:hypothetical protein